MKKLMILSFVFALLFAMGVLATDYSAFCNTGVTCYTLMAGGEPSLNGTNGINAEDIANYGWSKALGSAFVNYTNRKVADGNIAIGTLNADTGNGKRYYYDNPAVINYPVTYEFYMFAYNLHGPGTSIIQFGFGTTGYDGTGLIRAYNTGGISSGVWALFINGSGGGPIHLAADGFWSDEWVKFTIEFNPSNYYHLKFQNGTWKNVTTKDTQLARLFLYAKTNFNISIDSFRLWNGTIDDRPAGPPQPPTFVEPPTPVDGNVNNTGTIKINCTGNRNYMWFDSNPIPITARLKNTTSSEDNWTITGFPDGLYYYKSGCFNESQNQFSASNTSTRTFIVDNTNPDITSKLFGNKTTVITENLTFSINYTDANRIWKFNVSNSTSLLNETRINSSFFIYNASINISDKIAGKYDINTWACDGSNRDNCSFVNFTYNKITDKVAFQSQTIENNKETIRLVLNFTDTSLVQSDISAVLIYNHTKYSPTITSSGEIFTLTSNPYSPNITGASDKIPFHWEFNISSDLFNSTFYNQTIGNLLLIECSDIYVQHTLNISVWNESSPTLYVPVNLEHTYQVYDSNGVAYRSFNFTNNTIANFSLCIYPTVTITTDFHIDYAYGDTTFSYFAYQFNLSNATKTLNLYVSDGTIQITYNVVDNYENDIEGAYITVEKYDVGTNSYKVVETLKTDSEGNAIGRAVLYTAWYRFTISYLGENKLQEGPLKLTSDTKNFKISLAAEDWTDNWVDYRSASFALGWNNATKKFHLNYTDSQLVIDTLCLEVLNISTSTRANISSQCDSSTGLLGTLYGPGTSIGDVDDQAFLANAWVVVGGNYFNIGSLGVSFSKEIEFWKTEEGKAGLGTFMAFLLVLTLAMIGIWSPVMSILLALAGLGVARLLGIHIMEWPIFATLIALGIITIWRINNAQ